MEKYCRFFQFHVWWDEEKSFILKKGLHNLLKRSLWNIVKQHSKKWNEASNISSHVYSCFGKPFFPHQKCIYSLVFKMVWHLFLTVWYRFIPGLELPPASYGNIVTPCWPKKNTRPQSTKCRRNPLIIDHLADFLDSKPQVQTLWGVFLLQICIQYTNKSDAR